VWGRSPLHSSRARKSLRGCYHRVYTHLNTRWESQAYRQARIVVAVSTRIRQELIQIGVPEDRIRVIWNGVDPEEFSPRAADRGPFGLPATAPAALFVGDIRSPLKNMDTLLHALKETPDLHLAVAGDLRESPYPPLTARLGLAERVHFLGSRSDVPELMRAVDFFVLPSRYESFSLVLLEAMASGLPVVTTRMVGAAELVSPQCGFVLPDPADTAALARVLRELSGDPARRIRMGQAARNAAVLRSWALMGEAYLRVYGEALA
jgi:glycosyltransferase involved in cell wall biosynthesis